MKKLSRPTIAAGAVLFTLLAATPGSGQRRDGRPGRGRGDEVARSLPALQPAIDDAIDSGVECLLSRQLRDGSWSEHADEYGSGQTALSLYTLLESGLPPTHPAIEAGFAHLDGTAPSKVYTVACHLLAYGELRDSERRERLEELLDRLVDWQEGTFGYPGTPPGRLRGDRDERGDRGSWTDLSNTQYAALGLRAAQQAGLKVPAKVWTALLEATFAYQEEPRAVRDDPGEGRTSSADTETEHFPPVAQPADERGKPESPRDSAPRHASLGAARLRRSQRHNTAHENATGIPGRVPSAVPGGRRKVFGLGTRGTRVLAAAVRAILEF